MNLTGGAGVLPEPLARTIVEDGASRVRKLAFTVGREERLDFARAVVLGVVFAYWKALQAVSGRGRPLRELPCDVGLASVPEEAAEQAERIGIAAAGLDVLDSGYTIGVLYTGLMPGLVPGTARGLLHASGAVRAAAGHGDGGRCRLVLGASARPGLWRGCIPGAGGTPHGGQSEIQRRQGCAREHSAPVARFERDPFAAWMSQVFLDAALGDLCGEAGARLRSVVRVCDSLEQMPVGEGFDLVVGNPPYGRITLSPELRQKFRRSLFGHANLYGVFTDLALRFTRRAALSPT